MSSDPKKLTKEQKAAIALKAVSGDDNAKQELAKEHGVTVEEINEWIRETGAKSVEDESSVSLEASDDFAFSVEFGAVPDKLNYPRLIFWSAFGTAVIAIMIFTIMAIHSYTVTGAQQQRSAESQFYDISEIKQKDRAILDTFGVVDPEEGIYRIPIDSAMTIIAQD
jgi:hypothetical protein